MAQAIRKFDKGGGVSKDENKKEETTPKTRLFKLGPREIETDNLLRSADSNFESYLESTGWSRKKKEAFREAYGNYIKAIDAGNISARDLDRKWVDTTGVLTNTTGRGFDANGAVAQYLGTVAEALPDYIKPTKEEETPKKNPSLNFGVGFNKYLMNKTFGGGTFNKTVWYNKDPLDEKTKKRGIANRWKDYVSRFNEYADSLINNNDINLEGTAFQNREDLINRINAAREELNNSEYNNADWEKLAALGVNMDDYRDWFGETDDAVAAAAATAKPDNFTGKAATDVSKFNPKALEAGLLPRVGENGEQFYLTPDGKTIPSGIIGKNFDNVLDKLEGWYSVNNQLYDYNDYANWDKDIQDSYNRLVGQEDLNTIWTDPLFSQISEQTGLTHMADATRFFESLHKKGDNQLIRAYTKPKPGDPSSYKSQWFQQINGRFVPVTVDFDKNNNQWYINNNGTTTLIGTPRAAGTPLAEGSNDKVEWTRPQQFSFSNPETAYSQENIIGMLGRLGSYPNLLKDSRVSQWLTNLYKRRDSGELDNMMIEGKPLSRYIQNNVINANLVPNTRNRPLRVIRDDQGRVVGTTFDEIPTQERPQLSQKVIADPSSFQSFGSRGSIMKSGGIIKKQWGGTIQTVTNANKPINIDKKQKELNEKAANSYDEVKAVSVRGAFGDPTKEEQDLINAGGVLNPRDKVKLGAAVADLVSAGMGFFPGAHVASAGIGAASSVATFGADVSDGLDWSDVGNLGVNLGLDAISLIPGLKSIKATRALGTISKLAGGISTALATVTALSDSQRSSIGNTLSKITSGKFTDLNTDDFKNLSLVTSTLLGARNWAKSSSNGVAKAIRGDHKLPSQEKAVQVLVKGEATPMSVNLKNAQVQGKSAAEIKEAAIAAAKKKLATERGMSKEDIEKLGDNALTVVEGRKKHFVFGERKIPTKNVEGPRVQSEPGKVRKFFGLTPYQAKGNDRKAFQQIEMHYDDSFKKRFKQSKGKYMTGHTYNIPKRPKFNNWDQVVTGNMGLASEGYLRGMRAKGEAARQGIPSWEKYMQQLREKVSGELKQNAQKIRQPYYDKAGTDYMDYWMHPEFFRKGGSIPKFAGGNAIRNVSSKANWSSDIYGKKEFYDWLGSYNKDNYQDFNKSQASWYTNLQNTGYKPNASPVSFNQGVLDRQKAFNTYAGGVNNLIEGLASSGVIKRAGNSGDNLTGGYSDGYFGGQEYLRHGGLKGALDDNQIADINSRVNKNGLEYYFDEKTGMGNLRPLLQEVPLDADLNAALTVSKPKGVAGNAAKDITGKSTPVMANAPVSTGAAQVPASTPRNDAKTAQKPLGGKSFWNTLGNIDPVPFIQAGRLAGNIWNNNRVAKKTKEGLKPLLLDTWEAPRRVVGDLATKQAYYGQAAGLQSMAGRPRTSDASLQLAGQLEAGNRAASLRMQGDLADNQMIRQTQEAAWQSNAEAQARRSEVSNRNRASMLGIEKAKKDIDAARMSANWTSVENFMKEREYALTTNRERNRQFQLGVLSQNIQNASDAKLKPLRDSLQAMSDRGEDYTKSPLYKQYINTVEQVQKENANKYNQAYAKTYRLRMPFAKKGGSLTYSEHSKLQNQKDISAAERQNAKLFQRNIEKSVDTNIKMINNLSSVSKQLIIKSMT
jgi:hypothetical protein|nr:MAG TPA: hypothetical protein [Caudoviricetes sp.]